MSRPRVLIDADVVGRRRTGDETYTINLLRELPDVAHDLDLSCSLRHPSTLPADVEARVERFALPVSSPYRRIPSAFPRLAARAGASLVHVQYFVAPRLPCPAVVTVHDLSFVRAPELLRVRDRLLFRRFVPGSLRRARHVIAVSEFTRRDLADAYDIPLDRITAIPNGVSGAFRPLPDARRHVADRLGLAEEYVLFVGALTPRKNPVALLEAFERVARVHGVHQLVLAGADRGSGAAMRRRADELGLTGRLRLLGHVAEPDLPALYGAAEAVCVPSLYEGFGLPALEAMACGTPVVASGTTGLSEAVGDAALTFDPTSVDDIALALERVLGDASLRARLVEAGRARAAGFTWRRSAEATAQVYREAL
jgi:glycosyltransferase involved in cell wall biosynthesis